MIKFDVLSRFSGQVKFTAEIDCKESAPRSVKLGLAVRWAIENKANMTGADLAGANMTRTNLTEANMTEAYMAGAIMIEANLTDANMTDANMTGAIMIEANMTEANMTETNLTEANMAGANMTRAYMTRANMTRAYLSWANMTRANMAEAYLSRAYLAGANLTDAELSEADLRAFKSCFWMTLTENPNEVKGLASALRKGRVNGSVYSGECACLVGTIANVKGVHVNALNKNGSNPSEKWFMMISEGDTPDKETGGGYAARLALEWIEEWLLLGRARQKGG